MTWHTELWHWLVYAALSSLVLLIVAALAIYVCRQPVRRLRLIVLALAGLLVVPWINALAGLPGWSLGILGPDEAAPNSGPPNAPAIDAGPAAALVADAHADRGERSNVVEELPDGFVEGRGSRVADRQSPAVSIPARSSIVDPRSSATAPLGPEPSPPADNASQSTVSPSLVIVLVWLAAAAGLLLFWLSGVLRLWRLNRRSCPAPEKIQQLFFDIAGPAGRRVRIRASDRIDVPIVYGVIRPVIVLPNELCTSGRTDELRYCLAHEWSHIERRDVLAWHLASLATLLFFYQPLLWWLRRQMRLCQDYLADAAAAGCAVESEDYAEFLVTLARRRHSPSGSWSRPLPAALGFIDRRSQLFRRITMLVQRPLSLERRCRRGWSVFSTCIAVVLMAAVAVVRLDAAGTNADERPATKDAGATAPAAEAKKNKPAPKPVAEKRADETDHKPLTYNCRITDRLTGEPIAGATVEVILELSRDPKTNEWVDLRTITTTSNAKGEYSFTLKPEEVAQSSLYIVVDAHHPEYASKGRSGYAHSMIRKNLKMGERPFFEHIKLNPGKPVTGRVETPDGNPAAGVEVLAYTKLANNDPGRSFRLGSFTRTKTDEDGLFRIVAATPGEGVFWIRPEDYRPTAHHIAKDQRGDFGRFVLQKGIRLTGRVLDAKGRIVEEVAIQARRRGDGVEEVDQFLGRNAVANGIRRRVWVDDEGEFELGDLPPGDYRIEIEELTGKDRGSRRVYPPRHVFLPRQITLKEGVEPEPLEIRAAPHVEIHGTYLNGKGEPTPGHRLHLFGRVGEEGFYFTQSNAAGKDGKFMLKVPHGLERAQLSAITNEHGALRIRLGPGQPLRNDTSRIDLGTLESDVQGIEVVRYVAPILLIKAVDESGRQVDDFTPKAVYQTGDSPKNPNSFFISGVRGDVNFEKQPDGRWRSSQLLPDEKIVVTAEKDWHVTEPVTLTMKEEATRELVFVLKEDRENAIPPVKRARTADEALDLAKGTDLPLLDRADRMTISAGGRTKSIADAQTVKSVVELLQVEKRHSSGGETAATVKFFDGKLELREIQINAEDEWGFRRPGFSFPTGRNKALLDMVKKLAELK